MANNIKSYKNRLIDFGIVEGSFTPEGESEPIKYKQTVVRVEVDGEVEDLVLSGSNAIKPKFLELTLKASKKQTEDGTILDD